MFISIQIKGRFTDDYSEECLIDTSSVKMLIKNHGFYVIETEVGRFQVDKESYEDLRSVLYGKEDICTK